MATLESRPKHFHRCFGQRRSPPGLPPLWRASSAPPLRAGCFGCPGSQEESGVSGGPPSSVQEPQVPFLEAAEPVPRQLLETRGLPTVGESFQLPLLESTGLERVSPTWRVTLQTTPGFPAPLNPHIEPEPAGWWEPDERPPEIESWHSPRAEAQTLRFSGGAALDQHIISL